MNKQKSVDLTSPPGRKRRNPAAGSSDIILEDDSILQDSTRTGGQSIRKSPSPGAASSCSVRSSGSSIESASALTPALQRCDINSASPASRRSSSSRGEELDEELSTIVKVGAASAAPRAGVAKAVDIVEVVSPSKKLKRQETVSESEEEATVFETIVAAYAERKEDPFKTFTEHMRKYLERDDRYIDFKDIADHPRLWTVSLYDICDCLHQSEVCYLGDADMQWLRRRFKNNFDEDEEIKFSLFRACIYHAKCGKWPGGRCPFEKTNVFQRIAEGVLSAGHDDVLGRIVEAVGRFYESTNPALWKRLKKDTSAQSWRISLDELDQVLHFYKFYDMTTADHWWLHTQCAEDFDADGKVSLREFLAYVYLSVQKINEGSNSGVELVAASSAPPVVRPKPSKVHSRPFISYGTRKSTVIQKLAKVGRQVEDVGACKIDQHVAAGIAMEFSAEVVPHCQEGVVSVMSTQIATKSDKRGRPGQKRVYLQAVPECDSMVRSSSVDLTSRE